MTINYLGYTIRTSAFELVGVGRFMASVNITPARCDVPTLLDLPVSPGIYPTAEEAMDATVKYAQLVIDCVLSNTAAEQPECLTGEERR